MCCERLFGMDMDDLFAYQTMKARARAAPAARSRPGAALTLPPRPRLMFQVVKIRDRRLGILRLALILCILMFVVVFNIIKNTGATRPSTVASPPHVAVTRDARAATVSGARAAGYLKKEAPVGTLRFSILQPLLNPACDTPECPCDFNPVTKVSSASRLVGSRAPLTARPRPAQLRYCDKYTGPNPARTRYDCEFQDAVDIFPTTERSFMVTTRVKEQGQTRVCNDTALQCEYLFRMDYKRTYFIADIERYTMLMDHTAQASVIDVHGARERGAGRRVGHRSGPWPPSRRIVVALDS